MSIWNGSCLLLPAGKAQEAIPRDCNIKRPWRDIAITKTKTKTKIQGKAKEAIPRDCIKRPAQSSRALQSYGI